MNRLAPVTGVVRLNLHKKGVISKFRPGRPGSLAFEFNMIVSSPIMYYVLLVASERVCK